jgi:hypothetical protein
LGEVHRSFGNLDERAIDLRKPYRSSVLHKAGMHLDTIAYPTAGGPIGVTVVVDPVAVVGP